MGDVPHMCDLSKSFQEGRSGRRGTDGGGTLTKVRCKKDGNVTMSPPSD
jgi:hypothetical protein